MSNGANVSAAVLSGAMMDTKQNTQFLASFTADLRHGNFLECSGEMLRSISDFQKASTRMTDRWEVSACKIFSELA